MIRWNSEQLEAYRLTLRQRQTLAQANQAQRLVKANKLAKRAAALLKETFQAQQVAVFGSLIHGGWFSPTSDIDLAVWGLDPLTYLTAIAQLQDLSPEFKVDLIRMERCSPELEQVIRQEGMLL